MRGFDRIDRWWMVLLAAGAIVYLYYWPRDLVAFDEGLVLYEARRILEGKVLYRDMFELITPGMFYVLALVFAVFGTSMLTARLALAVLHATIMTLMFGIGRALGVRRALCGVAAVAHLAVGYPLMPFLSPHWASTGLAFLLLWLFVRPRPQRSASWTLAPGIVTGLLILVQQQRGVAMALGGSMVIVVTHLLSRSAGDRAMPLGKQLLYFVAGGASTVVPPLLALMTVTGFGPMFRALVVHPLVYYSDFNRSPWGGSFPWLALELLVPITVVKYLPGVIPVAAVCAALKWAWGAGRDELVPLVVSIVMASFAVLSVAYYPDWARLSVIAGFSLLLVAAVLESVLRLGDRVARVGQVGGAVLALVLAAALAYQLAENLKQRRLKYAFSASTAIGRVDFQSMSEVALVAAIQERMRYDPRRQLFCYPHCAGLYMTTGTTNPTAYQVLLPGYSQDEHIRDAIETLERYRVRYVVFGGSLMLGRTKTDPVLTYMMQKYAPVPPLPGQGPSGLFERRPEGP